MVKLKPLTFFCKALPIKVFAGVTGGGVFSISIDELVFSEVQKSPLRCPCFCSLNTLVTVLSLCLFLTGCQAQRNGQIGGTVVF